ncbi:MAG: molybdopterin-binding protein, partial [Proteobacteria bacterium]|nr:molybdopterin-binding protein [Pseudomonadota bacterium]
RFDHVFTSGGVGPTHDDVTMAGIAQGFATTVVRAPELEARVRAYWGAALADANLRIAEVPDGATLVYGRDAGGAPVTSWPVVAFRNVYILPGVPTLFRRKFGEIRERFRGAPVTVARIYVDADEGELAPILDGVVAAFARVKIGSYPRVAEPDFKVLLTLEGREPADVAGAYAMLAAALGARVVRGELPTP